MLTNDVVEPDDPVELNSCFGGDWAKVIVEVEPPLVAVYTAWKVDFWADCTLPVSSDNFDVVSPPPAPVVALDPDVVVVDEEDELPQAARRPEPLSATVPATIARLHLDTS